MYQSTLDKSTGHLSTFGPGYSENSSVTLVRAEAPFFIYGSDIKFQRPGYLGIIITFLM